MSILLKKFKEKVRNTDDVESINLTYFQSTMIIYGLKSLVDMKKTIQLIKKYIFMDTLPNPPESLEKSIFSLGTVYTNEMYKIINELLDGKVLIFLNNMELVVCIDPIEIQLNKAVEASINENVIQGSQIAFNESLLVNIGTMRKFYHSNQLKVKKFSFGNTRKRDTSLLYLEEITPEGLLDNVCRQIERNLKNDLKNLQDVIRYLGLNPRNIIPLINTTELPQEAISALEKGRIILFIESMPFALILPNLLSDMFITNNDQNFPIPMLIAIRLLRIIGILISLLVPGLYVALVAVNPEVFRIELALTIAQSREGVPYPAFIEMIIMLVIMEMIIEACIRMPSNIGTTITMVGGIILGQSVVEAKLVSNMMIIILAATTIASSTVNGFQNSASIRIFKFGIVILASIFGILGILVGFLIICIYLSSIEVFGIPFTHSVGKVKEEE
ncbi:spore germination protein [Clostridium sp. UBA1652]|uniref:spore germination protein n=1 Tax=Clostridium sp. UBA1652 TaxID=1946348 RepID=UPI00257AA273|nr:spore germination protein [Clostridium sp. UBA1652]